MNKEKAVPILDKLIIIFTILFIITLTNSIFFNQLGYYGALLLIIGKYFLEKKSPFKKSGLELAFIFFIAAELISSFLSINQPVAFNNLLKRGLLLPIVYFIPAASDNLHRAKMFFKVYLGAALISVLIYLINSYQYFINNLYQIKESGPSVFQYPITASEIISFTVIFLFAFLINEKQKVIYKVILFILLVLSLSALLSTYKRTGWIGTAAGLFTIIIIKRYWKLIIPIAVLGIIMLLIEKNSSSFSVSEMSGSKIKKSETFTTEGRANSIYNREDKIFVCDFENGVLEYKDSDLIKRIDLPAPVIEMKSWGEDHIAAFLNDTRLVLIKELNDSMFIEKEFGTPGLTKSIETANGFLYVMDEDSGLTVFKNLHNLKNSIYQPSIKSDSRIFIDSSFISYYSDHEELVRYRLVNGIPDSSKSVRISYPDIQSYFFKDNILLASSEKGLELYYTDSSGFKLLDIATGLKNITLIDYSDSNLFVVNLAGVISLIDISNNTIRTKSTFYLGYYPKAIKILDNKLFSSNVKRSRVASIFDPHNKSNLTRLALWKAGLKIFSDYPFFGVGDIDLAGLYKQYKNYYDKEVQGHLHNNFIHILVILGSFGFIAVMFLLFRVFMVNYNIYTASKDIPFVSSYALGAIGGFISFLFAGLTEWNFGDHEIITMVWFITGLNLAFYYALQKNNNEKKQALLSNKSDFVILRK